MKHKYCIFSLHLYLATDPNAARFPQRSRNRTYVISASQQALVGQLGLVVCLSLIALLFSLPLPGEPTCKGSHGLQSISSFSSSSQALPGQPSFYGRKRRLRLPDNARNRIGALYIVYCSHTVNVLDSSGLLETEGGLQCNVD